MPSRQIDEFSQKGNRKKLSLCPDLNPRRGRGRREGSEGVLQAGAELKVLPELLEGAAAADHFTPVVSRVVSRPDVGHVGVPQLVVEVPLARKENRLSEPSAAASGPILQSVEVGVFRERVSVGFLRRFKSGHSIALFT